MKGTPSNATATSIHDPLTGLYSRIYMADAVQRLCDLHDRNGSDAVIAILLDIDHFKQINDTFGHSQGDEVLRQVAQLILGMVREGDIAIRLGGEEFILFMTSKTAAEGQALAERIRRAIDGLVVVANKAPLNVKVSLGTAVRYRGETLLNLIERADRALYQAKRGGRNRVVASELSKPSQ